MKSMMKGADALLCTGEIVTTSNQLARLHPNGAKTAAFFLFLYLVCPFGFRFLTYSMATVYVAAVIIKIIASSGNHDLREANLRSSSSHGSPPLNPDSDEGVDQRPRKPKICAQMSKRRNFKVRIEDLETLENAEGNHASSSGFDDNRIDRDDGMSTEKGSRRGASSCEGKEGFQSQSEANDSSDEVEDEDEKDGPGERSQAVEWTEEDQQSLTDLGLSELERNKRLENLIAKRKVKKSASMKMQDNVLDLDISQLGSVLPVNIAKNHFVPPDLSGDAVELQLPGSAASVSLPERNPFDLPYDSNEEKPNLTVDGISPEILAPHPKDILNRNENFFQGPSVTNGTDEDSGAGSSSRLSVSEKRNVREPSLSRFRKESDKDQQDGQLFSQGEDPKSKLDASKDNLTTSTVHGDLKVSSDEEVNEKHREDASVGDETGKESTSSTSEDRDADVEVRNARSGSPPAR